MGWVVNATLRLLYPRKRPGTHFIGGWVGPRAGLDEGFGKMIRAGKSEVLGTPHNTHTTHTDSAVRGQQLTSCALA
jgi:hypothetical protein